MMYVIDMVLGGTICTYQVPWRMVQAFKQYQGFDATFERL
jgi:hypothetical protein